MSLDYPSTQGMSESHKRMIFEAGLTLYAIQATEYVLSSILTWGFPKARPTSIDELNTMSLANQKSTLGRVLTDLRKRADVEPDLDALLQRFLDDRNRFVHRIFTEVAEAPMNEEETRAAMCFLQTLQETCVSLQRILTAFLDRTENDPLFSHRTRSGEILKRKTT